MLDDLWMTWWRDAPRGGLQAEGGGVEAGGGEAAHKAQAPMYILLFCCLQQNSSHFISHPQPTPTPTLVSLSPVISNLQKMVSPFVPVHIPTSTSTSLRRKKEKTIADFCLDVK